MNPNAPAHLIVVEEWTDAAALEAHSTTQHFHHATKVFNEILAEPGIPPPHPE
ncbi:putative quinol monooxygenase [Nocardia thraciensis]